MPRDTDWDAIKAAYIAGSMGYRELARTYNVDFATLGRRARAEGWVAERKRVREDGHAAAIDAITEQRTRTLTAIMLGADRLTERIAQAAIDIDQARDLADAAKALKYAIDTIHVAYGIKTPAQLHRERMDEERLKLDRERLEMERKRDEADRNPPPMRIEVIAPAGEVLDE
jgi:hypothetical protein